MRKRLTWFTIAAVAWAAFGVAAAGSLGDQITYGWSYATTTTDDLVLSIPELEGVPPIVSITVTDDEMQFATVDAAVDLNEDVAWPAPAFEVSGAIHAIFGVGEELEDLQQYDGGLWAGTNEFDAGPVLEHQPLETGCTYQGQDSHAYPDGFADLGGISFVLDDPATLSQFREEPAHLIMEFWLDLQYPDETPDHCRRMINEWSGVVSVVITVSGCAGDVDGDDSVGQDDVIRTLERFGPCLGECPADLNGDGLIDGDDLAGVLGAWGACE